MGNNVSVSVPGKSLRGFLKYLMKNTKMACLTESALKNDEDLNEIEDDSEEVPDEDCQFLSANLHAKSKFGEDALANLSIEYKESTGRITGHVRIRSKGQGLALSMGDRVAELQRQRIIDNAYKNKIRV